MSDLGSILEKVVELPISIVERAFPRLSDEQQKTIVLWIIFVFVVLVLLVLSYLLAKEKFYIPLLAGLGLILLVYPVASFLGRHAGNRRKRHRGSEFQFVNREREKEYILRNHLSYYLIDAPAGYGKSVLISELAKGFQDHGWKLAHVVINKEDRFSDLLERIATELGIVYNVTQYRAGMQSRSSAIVHAIKENWKKDTNSLGLVLLIDFNEKPIFTVLKELVVDLIPDIQESLRTLDNFKNKRFRVVIAGRNIARYIKKHSTISFKEFMLSPFSYKYVKESVGNYLPDEDSDSVCQLSAYTMYLTGGHPDCIHKVLEKYVRVGNNPDDFIESYIDEIWNDIVYPTIFDVRESVPKRLQQGFDILSVFRYVDYEVLQELLDEEAFQDYEDQYNLADELTGAYLLTRNGRLLQDSITRRLFAIRLRRKDVGKAFTTYCKNAYLICLKKIKNPESKLIEKWAIECLFQALQGHVEVVNVIGERERLEKKFFNKIVLEVLEQLLTGRDVRAELEALLFEMEKDWEFRFTVNYFLRKKQFTDEPFLRLKQNIEQRLQKDLKGDSHV